ncbi:FmdB family zinc ribbon protein [Mycobacterium sp.]|uniref:FmdB family zinc ribbon protein n=1 Tax=Mycobacterium sp. TaxID=1785 RepID=UPI003A8548E7
MPTYSYACTECGHRFDQVQAFTDDTLTTCEQCSGRLRKLFNSVGVVFKGSGFYRTDSRESGRKEAGSTNGSTSAGSSTDAVSTSGSSESKPSTSGDSKPAASGDKAASSPAPATATS